MRTIELTSEQAYNLAIDAYGPAEDDRSQILFLDWLDTTGLPPLSDVSMVGMGGWEIAKGSLLVGEHSTTLQIEQNQETT